MRNIRVIASRELRSYFATPVAYVFIVIFLAFSGALAFYVGGFFDSGQASLISFFFYHTWLYLLLIPAISMRLWAEERKTGTIELLMTLPVSTTQAVLGKYLAAWGFAGIALALTFPMWVTVNVLGDPDNGVIVASYAGSFVMAGAFLAIGSCISAMTKNQVIAFIVAAAVCFLFTMSGLELVLNFFRLWAPDVLVETVASMSFLTHFKAVTKGVIDVRDVVYFASLIAVFLFANIVAVDSKKGDAVMTSSSRGKLTALGLVLSAVLFLSVNIASNNSFRSLRLDLTEGGLFTLSDATVRVLDEIDEPIAMRLYFSKVMGEQSPAHLTYFERVRELLEQYATLAGGKLRLQAFNPEPFSDDEDSAVAYGLSGLPINQQGDLGYFGLVGVNSTDDNEVIRFLSPERETFLEYDMTKMVKALATPEKQTVGVMSTLLVNGGYIPNQGQRPRWAVIDQINEFYAIQPVPVDSKEIFDNVGALLVIHPKRLPATALYAIDQFVLKGGRVMVFVDPNAEVDGPGGGMRPNEHSDFEKLFAQWGVRLRKDKVAGDLGTARRVNVRQGDRLAVADYVAWLALRPGNFDRANAVMSDLQVINVASAGILDAREAATTTVTPLIKTGLRSGEIDAAKVRLQPDVVGLFREFKPAGQQFTLAASVTGKAKSAFPDGPPAPLKGSSAEETKKNREAYEKAKKTHVKESAGGIHAIVVADVDMLHETLWAERQNLLGNPLMVPFANNADFVVNALENLMGGASLAHLRGRSISNRPFHLVRELRQDAERSFRAKEQELKQNLEDVRGKLNKLVRRESQAAARGGEVILKPEEKTAIEDFRREMIAIRKELRGVQHDLRKDIDSLDAWLKFLNIGAIPLLLGAGALIFAAARRMRRRRGVVETG